MTTGRIRRPAVAGYFYPSEPSALRQEIDRLSQPAKVAANLAQAVLVPHGSYARTGAILGAVFGRTAVPRRCVIIGPSHTGSWVPWSLMMNGAYRTPLGDVPIDERCAEALRMRCPFLTPDAWAQPGEHAIEVLVPFLQRLGPSDLSIVPLVCGADDEASAAELARALVQVVRLQEEPVLLIASSDLSHYAPERITRSHDQALLEAVCSLDPAALVRVAAEREIRMCGVQAVAIVLEAAQALGAAQGSVVAYGTSVAAGGDPDSAIGYAGVVFPSATSSG